MTLPPRLYDATRVMGRRGEEGGNTHTGGLKMPLCVSRLLGIGRPWLRAS